MTFYAVRSGVRFSALTLVLAVIYLVVGVGLRFLLQQEVGVFAMEALKLSLGAIVLTFLLGTGYGFLKQAAIRA